MEPHHTVEELREAVRRTSHVGERDCVRMVLHAKEGATDVAIGQQLSYTDRAVRNWIRRYNEGGLDELKDCPRSGRPRHLQSEQEEDVRRRLDAGAQAADGVCALRGEDVRRILEEEFGARYSLSGTYVVLHRIGYSSLVPRPRHPGADPAAQEEFEKTLREMVRSTARTHPTAEIQIWVQDEARFGQKGSLTRVWARRGSRPRAPKQTQYESLYLTGTVCPATGAAAAILTPRLNTEVVNLFF